LPAKHAYPPVGTPAPDFSLPSSDDRTINLKELCAKQRVVLYFYPKANTPGCTKQACGFRDARDQYENAGVAVIGVSPDPVLRVKKFVKKFRLNFPLLADADHAVCKLYGVWQRKSMFGLKFWGAARVTFIIAPGGRIEHIFERVKAEGHEKIVLDWLIANKSPVRT
jgi:peroxiredoxin Q/BCP